MKRSICILLALCAPVLAHAGEGTVIEATTATGEHVQLLPDGRWKFVDASRQAEAKKIADTYPENHLRPEAAQGGWFGTRMLMPGDKDYNRGSLNPKMR
jgi:hypothetical protein